MSRKVYIEKFQGNLGEVYSVRPEFMKTSIEKGNSMRGTIVFIPKHRRFAVLAFPGVHGVSRESFWPEDLTARCKRIKL